MITVRLAYNFREKNSSTFNDNFFFYIGIRFRTASYVGHLNELALWTVFKRLYKKTDPKKGKS